MTDQIPHILQRVKALLEKLETPADVIKKTSSLIIRSLGADIVDIHYLASNKKMYIYSSSPSNTKRSHLRVENNQLYFHNISVQSPAFCRCLEQSTLPGMFLTLENIRGTRSLGIIPIYFKSDLCGWLECRFFRKFCEWTDKDVFILKNLSDFVAQYVEEKINSGREDDNAQKESSFSDWKIFESVCKNGKVFMAKLDKNCKIVNIFGDTKAIFGVSDLSLLHDADVWKRYLKSSSYQAFRKFCIKQSPDKIFSQDVVIKNEKLQKLRYVTLTVKPTLDTQGNLSGWECLGIDISKEKKEKLKLTVQNKRMTALYNISLALQGVQDVQQVLNNGLNALLLASEASAGYIVLYRQDPKHFEIGAIKGFSLNFNNRLLSRINRINSFSKEIVRGHAGEVIKDISQSSYSDINFACSEGQKQNITVPLVVDGEIKPFGVVSLFCCNEKKENPFDYKFITTAVSQIAFALKKVEKLNSERIESQTVSALYKLSRELSKLTSTREVVKRIFPILNKNFECKRIWFGIIDDLGLSLSGQGCAGAELKESMGEFQIDLEKTKESFFKKIIREEKIVVVDKLGDIKHPKVKFLISQLQIKNIIFIPLIAANKVIGILAVEPNIKLENFMNLYVPTLHSLANEIGAVILNNYLNNSSIESIKMKTVGLLTSGIAHNFNNMLQSIMGQASIISMQSSANQQIKSSATEIINTVDNGARLLHQMMFLTQQSTMNQKEFSINSLLNDSFELFSGILGDKIRFEINTQPILSNIIADYGQIQKVITLLLNNAKDAVRDVENPVIKIVTREVNFTKGEIDKDIKEGGYICISVSDNGTGMSEDVIKHCFEPFFTTKEKDLRTGIGFNPSGLGLSLGYSILKQHKGTITVKSKEGSGTTFSLFIPIPDNNKSDKVDNYKVEKEVFNVSYASISLDQETSFTLQEECKHLIKKFDNFDSVDDLINQRKKNAIYDVLLVNLDKLESIISDVKQLKRIFRGCLFIGFSSEPEKWSGLLRYEVDMRVFKNQLDEWTLGAVKDVINGTFISDKEKSSARKDINILNVDYGNLQSSDLDDLYPDDFVSSESSALFSPTTRERIVN